MVIKALKHILKVLMVLLETDGREETNIKLEIFNIEALHLVNFKNIQLFNGIFFYK